MAERRSSGGTMPCSDPSTLECRVAWVADAPLERLHAAHRVILESILTRDHPGTTAHLPIVDPMSSGCWEPRALVADRAPELPVWPKVRFATCY